MQWHISLILEFDWWFCYIIASDMSHSEKNLCKNKMFLFFNKSVKIVINWWIKWFYRFMWGRGVAESKSHSNAWAHVLGGNGKPMVTLIWMNSWGRNETWLKLFNTCLKTVYEAKGGGGGHCWFHMSQCGLAHVHRDKMVKFMKRVLQEKTTLEFSIL